MEIKVICEYFTLIPEEHISEGCFLKCPDCDEYSVHSDWSESEVCCEICDTHYAIRCPECGYYIDHVWADPIEIKPAS